MATAGVPHVAALLGGLDAWIALGYRTVDDPNALTDMQRYVKPGGVNAAPSDDEGIFSPP
jgi:3-mercaptopyruvate sulfurtransferase SseA